LAVLFNAGIAVSIGGTVASSGMSFSLRQLVAPLRRAGLVASVIIFNALVTPAAAWGIANVSPMADQFQDKLRRST
jgi:predicted Na+-dependent transporter